MQSLKVTARIDGQIAGDIPMLDSLVEFQVAHKCDPSYLAEVQPDGKHIPGTIPIPISRRRIDGFQWPIPLSSSPIFRSANDVHEHFSRRFDPDLTSIDVARHRVIATSGGEFKSYRLPLRSRLIDRVVWFCVGRGAELRQILKGVIFLGKKSSQGWGPVREWKVEPAEFDYSWFAPHPSGRVLMRPLPVFDPGILGARKMFCGLVSPYWEAEYFAEGMIPC